MVASSLCDAWEKNYTTLQKCHDRSLSCGKLAEFLAGKENAADPL
jgi:hypothetical protein